MLYNNGRGDNMKTMTLKISEELHRKLKLLCVSRGIGMGKLIAQLIEKEVEGAATDGK